MLEPSFLFLQTNQRCNLKCNHCYYWKMNDDDKSNYFPTESRDWLIKEFAEIGGKTIVTCGGEPTLDYPDWLNLARLARLNRLKMFSVTNGTRIHTLKRAVEVIAEGPDEISISLDGHSAATHDSDRGVKGAFFVATRALSLLLHARKMSESKKRIYAMTIVHGNNYKSLPDFYDLVLNTLGADKLKLNIIQPTFQGGSADDTYFANNMVQDTDDLVGVLNDCNLRFKLNLNPVWIGQVKRYFDDVKAREPHKGWWSSSAYGTSEHLCNTYERNIMVNMQGVARLCFADAFPGHPLKTPGDLAYFWQKFAAPVRTAMAGCNRYCSISHSVRREHATLRIVDTPP